MIRFPKILHLNTNLTLCLQESDKTQIGIKRKNEQKIKILVGISAMEKNKYILGIRHL